MKDHTVFCFPIQTCLRKLCFTSYRSNFLVQSDWRNLQSPMSQRKASISSISCVNIFTKERQYQRILLLVGCVQECAVTLKLTQTCYEYLCLFWGIRPVQKEILINSLKNISVFPTVSNYRLKYAIIQSDCRIS